MQFPTLLKGLYIPVIIWWISFLSGFLGNQTASRVQEVILSGDNPPSPRPFYLIKSSLANVVRYHHFVPWIGWFMNFSSSKYCFPYLLPTCKAWFKKHYLCVIMYEVIMCDSSLTKSKSFWRVAQCLHIFIFTSCIKTNVCNSKKPGELAVGLPIQYINILISNINI